MKESKKSIKEMDTDEILRQQLELLAAASQHCINNDELSRLTHSMAEICSLYSRYRP